MIDVGIINCDNEAAYELVTLLINHPDVKINWIASSIRPGQRIDGLIPSLIGECDLVTVGDTPPLNDIDVVVLCGTQENTRRWLTATTPPPGLRIIDMSGCHTADLTDGWTYGLPEINRRALVHDCMRVAMPSPWAIAMLLTLIPLGKNLLLNAPLRIMVESGPWMRQTTPSQPEDAVAEVKQALRALQTSFNQEIELHTGDLNMPRALRVTASMNCDVRVELLKQLYEEYYDDHNFVFITDAPMRPTDVANTNKCLLHLYKDPSGRLTVSAVMDGMLKGLSGTAVHNLNLIFNLHERVGLFLKSCRC